MKSCNKGVRRRERAAAFTVTELMVAVSLMTLIVLALYSMFDQVTKAMRANEAQVDSAERGRGVLELVSRELESVRVGFRHDATNLWLRTPMASLTQNDFTVGVATSSVALRSNVFDDVYFLTKSGRAWTGVGLTVLQATNATGKELLRRPAGGLGTLYRYETPIADRQYAHAMPSLSQGFITNLPTPVGASLPPVTNYSQVAQGIVHFRVLPYDTKGQLMAFFTTNIDANFRMIRTGPMGTMRYPLSNVQGTLVTNANVVLAQASQMDPLMTMSSFTSNAVPAYLELELGVLEPDALRTYNQMIADEQGAQAKIFLEKRIAKVQIFRKRIPLRTVAQ